MSTITKERVAQFIKNPLDNGLTRGEQMELASIALASLEAEPVGEVSEQRDGLVMDGTIDLGGASTHRIIKGASKMKRLPLGTKFYTAPPAPVALTSGYSDFEEIWSSSTHPLTQDDEMKDFAWDIWNACRAAMLQRVENTESRCTMQPASALDSLPQNADSRCSNSPVFPDGWVMVPVEPTEEMLAELCLVKGWTARALNARYQAMLAAAPKPEA